MDAEGYIYVSNWNTNTIHKYTPDGSSITAIGEAGLGPGEYFDAAGFSVDDDGLVYVLSPFAQQIFVYEPVD